MGPFDRFNDRAKRVLALAQDEAIRFNHNYIGVEHLLLGLVREGEGVAARVLDSLGIDLSRARSSVEVMIGRGKETTSPSEITLSPRTKKVIELAVDESRKLGHSHVGTGGDVWTHRLLAELGVDLADLVTRIDAAAPRNEGPRPARLDEQAALTEVFARAASFASERNSALIRSGHLLLAIAASDSVGGNVLKAVGATPGCIREILDRMNG